MAGKSTTKFRSVSSHVEDLASGQTFGPGEVVDLSAEDQKDPHNKRLLDEGILVEADAKDKEGGSD